MSSWIYWQNCIALGKMMCFDPSDLQPILHGEANKCCYQFWVCRETIPSHITWRLSGMQQAIFQNANWHLIIQKSPSAIPCFARLILIYLNVFFFCWLLVFQFTWRTTGYEPQTLDLQSCYFFFYLIESLGDTVICKMMFLRLSWIPDIHMDVFKMWTFPNIYIKNRVFVQM